MSSMHGGMHMVNNMTGMGKHNGTHMPMDHGMKMYFHFSKKVVILFEGWDIDSAGGIVWSCIVLFIMAALYEGLKIGREVLKRREFDRMQPEPVSSCTANGTSGKQKGASELSFMQPRKRLTSPLHLAQTVLHMVQVFVGYLLMLAFMTYNAWLCIAIIFGAGLGYFLFGWYRTSILELGDHCL